MFIRIQYRNEAVKPTQILEDRRKEENLARIKASFKVNKINYYDYFNQLSHQVTYPNGKDDRKTL